MKTGKQTNSSYQMVKKRNTMSRWLRFLCSFCLHIIHSSLYYFDLREQIRSCSYCAELMKSTLPLLDAPSINLEAYLQTKQVTHTIVQYKTAIRV